MGVRPSPWWRSRPPRESGDKLRRELSQALARPKRLLSRSASRPLFRSKSIPMVIGGEGGHAERRDDDVERTKSGRLVVKEGREEGAPRFCHSVFEPLV
jgi:hypothetical protein